MAQKKELESMMLDPYLIENCILEEDLKCPKHLHTLHKDPESLTINGVSKLIPNVTNKKAMCPKL